MNVTLIPYLNFNGQTKEAMKFYQSVLGGDLTMQTYGESGVTSDPKEINLIVHAELKNDFLIIMASDGNKEHPVTMGNSVNLSLNGSDRELLSGFFNQLSERGKIQMPLEKQFWGDTYGMFTDKFGINWTINISAK